MLTRKRSSGALKFPSGFAGATLSQFAPTKSSPKGGNIQGFVKYSG